MVSSDRHPLVDDWWHNPSTYSPMNDPDGEMAKRYHEAHGEWPEGSRQHFEQRRRDDYERGKPFRRSAHPGFDYLFPSVVARLRERKFSARQRVSREVLLDRMTAHVEEFAASIWDDMIFSIQARVLTEDLPPARIEDSTVIEFEVAPPRPATWRDFWKLAHGHRWPVRWWVRRHPPRLVEPPQRARFRVRHSVSSAPFRAYPHADIRVRDKLGAAYLNVPIHTSMAFFGADEEPPEVWA